MALRHRRGVYSDFNPQKMVSGEIASVQSGDPNTASGESVYACQNAGTVKRLAFVEDVEAEVYNLTDDISDIINQRVADNVTAAQTAANNAAASASQAASYVTQFIDSDSNGNIIITIGTNDTLPEEPIEEEIITEG